MRQIRHWIYLWTALASGAWATLGFAQGTTNSANLERGPSAAVVLTLSGHITRHNAPQQYRWTLPMLEALPQHSFTTMTPWAQQPLQFSGPLLRDVLQAAGAQGQHLVARALNDYSVQIPVQDALSYDMVVATRMNGQPMSVRQRGPLFVVYPFDSKPELKSATYIERSIWQLHAIEVQ